MWRLAPVLVSVAPACLVNTAKNDQDRLYSLLVLPNKIDQIVLMIELLLRAGQGRVLHTLLSSRYCMQHHACTTTVLLILL